MPRKFIGGVTSPVNDPDPATKLYVDSFLPSNPNDVAMYGDQFSTIERRVATSQDTLSAGFLSFSLGIAPRALNGATKLTFNVRGVTPAGAVIAMALYKGVSRTALAKVDADITVTSNFSTLGTRELTIPAFSCNRGDIVALGILRTGTGTPDPAMSTSAGPAQAALLNPSSTTMVTGFKGAQSALPDPLDTSASFTASGRIFWFSLA